VAGSDSYYTNFFSFTQQALRMHLHAVTNGKSNNVVSYLFVYFTCLLFMYGYRKMWIAIKINVVFKSEERNQSHR